MTHQWNNLNLTPGIPVVVIIGPTAVGKTELSLELAEQFDIEIINADSRYLYRGLDIGTAKPTLAERSKVPHHLVDILNPDESYSLAEFLDSAYELVEQIHQRGRLPVLVGGTPQYMKAFMEGWQMPRVAPDHDFRDRMKSLPVEDVYQRVLAVDPESAERIGPSNPRRLIRALEVFEKTGRPMSEQAGKCPPPYQLIRVGLRRERTDLHQRIEDRARVMFQSGLLDEARELLPYDDDLPAMSSISYPAARAVVRGEITVEEGIEQTCFANNRYVRHQETWFRKFKDVTWFDASDEDLTALVARHIREQLSTGDSV